MPDSETIFFAVTALIVGLSIGSFLNVVALRSLWNEEFVKSRSRCPKCKHNLNWYNNIPVLSYIFQGGKCQFCKCKISPQYPIVEAVCGLLFLLTYLSFGVSLKSFFVLILVSLFILMIITDIKEEIVFDWHSYPVIPIGLMYSFLHYGYITIWESFLGIVVGVVVFETLSLIGYLFSKSRAFGFGDTIIAMGLGATFGWKMLLVIIAASVLFQGLFVIPSFFIRSFKNKNYKMCLAIAMAVLFLVVYALMAFAVHVFLLPSACLLLPLAVLAWCIFVFLKSMKGKETQDMYHLPFGPPLLIFGIISLFLPFDLPLLILNAINYIL